MDRFILDHAKESPALDAMRRSILAGRSGRAAVRRVLRRSRRGSAAAARRARARPARRRAIGCHWRRAIDAGRRRRAIWSFREASLGLSMAMKGDAKSLSFVEDTAVAPEKLRDYIDGSCRSSASTARSAGVYAHASVGCLHVRPVVNLKTADGRADSSRRSPTTSPTWCSSSAARCPASMATGWCAARSRRRCSGRCSTRRSARSSARSIRRASSIPGKIVDAPPMTRTCATAPAT